MGFIGLQFDSIKQQYILFSWHSCWTFVLLFENKISARTGWSIISGNTRNIVSITEKCQSDKISHLYWFKITENHTFPMFVVACMVSDLHQRINGKHSSQTMREMRHGTVSSVTIGAGGKLWVVNKSKTTAHPEPFKLEKNQWSSKKYDSKS